jgi:hypothetical protein
MSVSPKETIIMELSHQFKKLNFHLNKAFSEFRQTLQNDDIAAVGVGLLPASRQGFYKAAVTAHIRIEAIEQVYVGYHPYLQPRDRKGHYTISINCDNIFGDKTVSQSHELPSHEASTLLAERLWRAISGDVLPFLKKYCDRGRLVENLEIDDYTVWVTSDRMARYCVLISDRVLKHDEDGFEKYSSEFLAYCEKPHGEMYRQAANSIVFGLRDQYFKNV